MQVDVDASPLLVHGTWGQDGFTVTHLPAPVAPEAPAEPFVADSPTPTAAQSGLVLCKVRGALQSSGTALTAAQQKLRPQGDPCCVYLDQKVGS